MVSPYIYVGLGARERFLAKNSIRVGDKDEIIKSVSFTLGISIEDMKSSKRHRDIVIARQICMGLIRRSNPEISLVSIGKIFKRDHSTVIYSLGIFDDLYGLDKEFTHKVDHVLRFTNYD